MSKITKMLKKWGWFAACVGGMAGASEESVEDLQSKLEATKTKTHELEEKAQLKDKIQQEERKQRALQQGDNPPSTDNTPQQSEKNERSKWVRERDRVEEQVKDKVDKVKKLF